MKKELIKIFVNGVEKEVEKRDYSFEEVIILAFGSFESSQMSYTVVSIRKNQDGDKEKRVYAYGDMIKMKEGLKINVDSTNRS